MEPLQQSCAVLPCDVTLPNNKRKQVTFVVSVSVSPGPEVEVKLLAKARTQFHRQAHSQSSSASAPRHMGLSIGLLLPSTHDSAFWASPRVKERGVGG